MRSAGLSIPANAGSNFLQPPQQLTIAARLLTAARQSWGREVIV